MSSKLAELGFEDVGDGHSERLVDRSWWHLQASNQFHKGLFIHYAFSLELPHIFRCDIDGIDCTDRYELNSFLTKPNPLQIILQSILDSGKALRIPVYPIHFVHSDNQFVHS